MDLAKFMEQKEKIRKAQALYEPWMDNKKEVQQNDEISPSPPTQSANPKHRSEFVFHNEYVKTVTNTPNSEQVGEETLNCFATLQTVTSVRSTMPLSRNSSVSIYLPPSETPHQPTPLPIDERRKCYCFA
ncbi:unnamed protein product [Anisakis simplex]|uniref:Uncharacterized protein n=1 Tax=Anisakis simplex TaxID=6269 RepID=A0A0M3JTA7_ANISI|nr:unnamed protein product [Anisakis simplex]